MPKMRNRDVGPLQEIAHAEESRADALMRSQVFTEWVNDFRRAIIVEGFLAPLYSSRGSDHRLRVKRFGNFVAPDDALGRLFTNRTQDRVVNEQMWFWDYLQDGMGYGPPPQVWSKIAKVIKILGLAGKPGGGLFVGSAELDRADLLRPVKPQRQTDGEDGYMAPYYLPEEPLWLVLFRQYRGVDLSDLGLEIRPPWFHIANYAFFNKPLSRLPIFWALVGSKGQLDSIEFLPGKLSAAAKELVGTRLLALPRQAEELVALLKDDKERRNMTWWLWRNVGHLDHRSPLSWGEISKLDYYSTGAVRGAISGFDTKLRRGIDGQLLRQLLETGERVGLGREMVFNYLVRERLLPPKTRMPDDFDASAPA